MKHAYGALGAHHEGGGLATANQKGVNERAVKVMHEEHAKENLIRDRTNASRITSNYI